MASLDDFKPDIRPEVPGCPDPLLEKYLKRIIERFCRETWIWQTDQDLSVTEGDDKFTISPPSGTSIVNVVKVKTDSDLEVTSFIWDPVEVKLVFQNKINKDATWSVKLALKPDKTASATYKDFLLNDWNEAIAYGTLWQLLALKQQPFFNGELSQIYGQHYFAKESKAKIEANQMRNGQRNLRVKPQPFV